MARLHITLCLLTLLFAAVTARAGERVWQYTDGRRFTAGFQWADAETIYLKSSEGKEFQLALGALCNDDLAFVRAIDGKLRAQGIVYEAPLVWEEFRSKNFTAQEADKAGYYPLDSQVTSGGSLRLEFRRFGGPPEIPPNHRVVLRMTTSKRPEGGTKSQIRVIHDGKVAGATSSALPPGGSFEVALPPLVLTGGNKIFLEVACGPDTVLIRTGKSGAGPRLLIVGPKPE